MAADPRRAHPRSSTIPSRYAEDTLEDWVNCSKFPTDGVQNIGEISLVKRLGKVFLSLRIGEDPPAAGFVRGNT